jgi:hypothetical protein
LGLHIWLPDAMEGEHSLNNNVCKENTAKVTNF